MLKKMIFFALAFIFLGIGIAGIILPLVPGAPFLFIASFFFAKGSRRIDNWFKSTAIYDKYVLGLLEKRGMTLKEKIRINLIADFFILFTVLYVDIPIVKIIFITLALMKHYYFFRKMKTIKA